MRSVQVTNQPSCPFQCKCGFRQQRQVKDAALAGHTLPEYFIKAIAVLDMKVNQKKGNKRTNNAHVAGFHRWKGPPIEGRKKSGQDINGDCYPQKSAAKQDYPKGAFI